MGVGVLIFAALGASLSEHKLTRILCGLFALVAVVLLIEEAVRLNDFRKFWILFPFVCMAYWTGRAAKRYLDKP